MDSADRQARHRASTEAVLGYAWDAPDFGADQVITALGMTRSTALTAVDTLIDLGLVAELSGATAKPGQKLGRPARRFQLRSDAGLVVGLDAGGRSYTAILTDLAGREVAREHLDVENLAEQGNPSPALRREAAFEVIDAALASAGRTRAEVVAVGVGVPAPVDGAGVSPSHPSGFWRYMNADLHAALGAEFPVVRVENDAALAAMAEGALGQAVGKRHFVAMLSGLRLGSGVFLEGSLVRGAHGGVGELEALAHVAGVGGTWGLGYLAEQWVRAQLGRGAVPPNHPWAQLGVDDVTAEVVLRQARLADPVSRQLVEELGAMLGRICAVLARFYDPEVIVVCGAVAGALGEVIDLATSRMADDLEIPPPAILASSLGRDVVALGAVSAAREAALGIVLTLFTERSLPAFD